MIRTTQPDDVRGWDAVFKYLRLPGCQNQFRCGISLGSLTHLAVRTVINPFPLTVRDRKRSRARAREYRCTSSCPRASSRNRESRVPFQPVLLKSSYIAGEALLRDT